MTRKAILDKDIVKQLRGEYIPYVMGYKRLAKKHGLKVSTVRDCVQYHTHKHVREWEE